MKGREMNVRNIQISRVGRGIVGTFKAQTIHDALGMYFDQRGWQRSRQHPDDILEYNLYEGGFSFLTVE